MSERYTRLFTLPENLYVAGSPVVISAGALLKDNQTGRVLAQLKIKSISDRIINAVRIKIASYDIAGESVDTEQNYEYLDLNVERNSEFGQKNPIYLSNSSVRSFSVRVTEVFFAEGDPVKIEENEWKSLIVPQNMQEYLENDNELIRQYKLDYNVTCKNVFIEDRDLWICSCGNLNKHGEDECHGCGCLYETLKGFSKETLVQSANERVEAEKKAEQKAEEERRLEIERKKAEALKKAVKRAKRNKKIAIITTPIVCAIIIFIIILNVFIIPNVKYNDAISLMDEGKYYEAINLFEELDDYKDSESKQLICLEKNAVKETVSAGGYHTVGLKSDGTVVAVGDKDYGKCKVKGWTDIISVSAGDEHTVGLKSNGTVVAVGYNYYGQCDVKDWTDIISVSAGDEHTVGLKSNGTVVAVGYNVYGQCDVENWTDIIAVSAGTFHTVGLKSDGTVVAVGKNGVGQCNVEEWTDIISVSAGAFHTVGLKSNGTVVAVGDNDYSQCNVEDWAEIIAASAGRQHIVGLKSDGTVVAVGNNGYGQCDVENWTDIIAVSAGDEHTVGLKSDGTVVAVGKNYYRQCDVEDWTDIKIPKK